MLVKKILNYLLFPLSNPVLPRFFFLTAVDKVLQGINGTLFTGASSICYMAPLPSAPARIYCLPCLFHDQGLNGYTVCSYQQNHEPKCQKFEGTVVRAIFIVDAVISAWTFLS